MNDKTVKGLLIEDDADDADLFMILMKRAHWPSYQFAFERAQTLKAGIDILSRGSIEVVLLDIMLPDSSGIESVRRLRSLFPGVPIVVLTGLRDEAGGIEALRNGAQDYQVKGNLDGDALKRTIGYAVERHRALARMETIINRSADGIVVANLKGVVKHINPAAEALFRCKPGEFLERPFPHPLSPGRSAEVMIPGEAGEERTAQMRVSEIEWEGEAARLALIRDITDLRRIVQLKAEIKERRKLDKLKDELIGTVSHEMRNPLAVIKVTASLINKEFKGALSAQQARLIAMQDRNIGRLQKIIENILDLSRLESGAASIQPQRVDAGQLISATAQGFQLIGKAPEIPIRAEIPPDLPPLRADPELLIRLLTNLLDNAMRYARSRITVRAEADGAGKQMKISVIDDGKGVPEGRQGDLFNKFVQVGRSSQKGIGYKGTGLGLAICKEIVERMGGRIWIESKAGHGAAFHFVLPLDTPTAAATPRGRALGGVPE